MKRNEYECQVILTISKHPADWTSAIGLFYLNPFYDFWLPWEFVDMIVFSGQLTYFGEERETLVDMGHSKLIGLLYANR